MNAIAKTPEPPYYAVIFTSERTQGENGYAAMAEEMMLLVHEQPGFLGVETAREGVSITVSYWASLEAIENWKQNVRHRVAQTLGYETWYESFATRVCRVERDNIFYRSDDH